MSEYHGAHLAPTDEDGYAITQVRDAFGDDVLEHPDWYGTFDEQTLRQLRAALAGADTVRIYRAVPAGVTTINHGDWVSLSRDYAHDHGWNEDPGQIMPVLAADVPAASVFTDGNDLSEWGYVGEPIAGLTLHEGDPEPNLVELRETTGEELAMTESSAQPEAPTRELTAERELAEHRETELQAVESNNEEIAYEEAVPLASDDTMELDESETPRTSIGQRAVEVVALTEALGEATDKATTQLARVEQALTGGAAIAAAEDLVDSNTLNRVEEVRRSLGVSRAQMTPEEITRADERTTVPVVERANAVRDLLANAPIVEDVTQAPAAAHDMRELLAPTLTPADAHTILN